MTNNTQPVWASWSVHSSYWPLTGQTRNTDLMAYQSAREALQAWAEKASTRFPALNNWPEMTDDEIRREQASRMTDVFEIKVQPRKPVVEEELVKVVETKKKKGKKRPAINVDEESLQELQSLEVPDHQPKTKQRKAKPTTRASKEKIVCA